MLWQPVDSDHYCPLFMWLLIDVAGWILKCPELYSLLRFIQTELQNRSDRAFLALNKHLRLNHSVTTVFLFCLVVTFNRSTLLGKVLRVDVDFNDNSAPYSIPSDNPFLGEKEARPGKWISCLCGRLWSCLVTLKMLNGTLINANLA